MVTRGFRFEKLLFFGEKLLFFGEKLLFFDFYSKNYFTIR